ncbi:hypothetical protein F2Q69_00052297 [Brassica cretica]|uniref:Uncharacterized protein n=1 Tax=Brassica cretica TaxID=69181 RepID=A0A8S9MTM6_BRACR|nr:hypothetical protein F2Q69_00052297 [Brassica cretica]
MNPVDFRNSDDIHPRVEEVQSPKMLLGRGMKNPVAKDVEKVHHYYASESNELPYDLDSEEA